MKKYHTHQARYYAFPSGHIATAMAAVTVMSENYPEIGWLKPVGYSLVGLIGVSLVDRGYHWYSDLPLGVVIGHVFGMIAAHPRGGAPSMGSENKPIKLTLAPVLVPRGGGVSFAMSF